MSVSIIQEHIVHVIIDVIFLNKSFSELLYFFLLLFPICSSLFAVDLVRYVCVIKIRFIILFFLFGGFKIIFLSGNWFFSGKTNIFANFYMIYLRLLTLKGKLMELIQRGYYFVEINYFYIYVQCYAINYKLSMFTVDSSYKATIRTLFLRNKRICIKTKEKRKFRKLN